ncbi:MAG: hypothetical protein ACLSE8_01615 [Parasutterella sp.]
MAEKLERLGMKGVWEGVLEIVTNPRLIGRPHFAAWLAPKRLCRGLQRRLLQVSLRVVNPVT